MQDINDNSKTPEVQLSPDAHWLYVVAYKKSDIAMANQVLRKEAFYLHSIDDIMKEDFTLGHGENKVTNKDIGLDSHVVNQLKKYGEAEQHWIGRDIWFAYKLTALKHADMMRKKID